MNEHRPQAARIFVVAAMLAVAAALLGMFAATLADGTLRVLLIVVAVVLVFGVGVALGMALSATRRDGPGGKRGP